MTTFCYVFQELVLRGCGILNLFSVFSCPKTEVSVSGFVLALKYVKIGKVHAIHILSPALESVSSKKKCVVLFLAI